MPTRSKSPMTGLGLLDSVLGDSGRTWRMVCLLLAVALAAVVVLVPILITVSMFGTVGAAALGSVSTLTAAGVAVRRLRRLVRQRDPESKTTPES